jgi:hypothetical protein
MVLEFEPDVAATDFAERAARVAIGDGDRAADGRCCGRDISERERQTAEIGSDDLLVLP